MRQRPDFRKAKQAHRQPYKEQAESTGEGINPIDPAHQARQNYRQQLQGSEEYNFSVHLELDGNIIFQQARLHPRNGDLQPGLNRKNRSIS